MKQLPLTPNSTRTCIGDYGNSMAGGFFAGTPGGSQATPSEKKVLNYVFNITLCDVLIYI